MAACQTQIAWPDMLFMQSTVPRISGRRRADFRSAWVSFPLGLGDPWVMLTHPLPEAPIILVAYFSISMITIPADPKYLGEVVYR